ncbi:hypothetical protein BDV23DRAFT_148470 [Aspergillus alliaceus]|uniref:Uncharacterized protein n=1 Tax=Petromyces alliaceus TaxID=209559 RepID=A0A5N7CIJ8_PETAA|nr:hypothetical protein BDV23DRAFT_148470 [Aspergillus alliaceus]
MRGLERRNQTSGRWRQNKLNPDQKAKPQIGLKRGKLGIGLRMHEFFFPEPGLYDLSQRYLFCDQIVVVVVITVTAAARRTNSVINLVQMETMVEAGWGFREGVSEGGKEPHQKGPISPAQRHGKIE